MKEELCKEFCNQIQVHAVPAGFAVGTEFMGLDGDPIGFYIVGPNSQGQFRIEDNGSTVLILESSGADLELESRAELFGELLSEYHATYDDERGELKTDALPARDVPKAALRFVALLLRLQDMMLLVRERVENTFRQEAMRDLRAAIGTRAEIAEDDVIDDELSEFKADVVIRARDAYPVAVFFVMSDAKLYEAMLLQSEADNKAHIPCKVVALMERGEDSVSKRVFNQAMNRLVPLRYRGNQQDAMARIVREAETSRRIGAH